MELLEVLRHGESSVTVTQAGPPAFVKVNVSKWDGIEISPGQFLDALQIEATPEEGTVLDIAGSDAVMLPKKGPLQTEQIPPPAVQVAGVIVSDQQDRTP